MSNILLKAEPAVSKAGNNFTTNLVLLILELVAHGAHHILFRITFNACCFCFTELCNVLAFSRNGDITSLL